MPCQVVSSQSQLQARLPTLPQKLPTTQADWTTFLTAVQQWGQALQQEPYAPNVVPQALQTVTTASGAVAIAALTSANCKASVDSSHQYYGAVSLQVSGISSGGTLQFSGSPIPINPASRWYCSFQIYAPSGCTGSLAVITGAKTYSESFTVPSSGSWQQVWGLFDLTADSSVSATWKFTFTSTATVNLDGMQMNLVGRTLAFLPKFTSPPMGPGTTQWLAGSPYAFVAEASLMKIGGVTAWDTTAYTGMGHDSCHVIAKPSSLSDICMIGLSTTPTANVNFNNNEFSIYNDSGTWHVFTSGTDQGSFGTAKLSDVVAVTYDGTNLRALLNGSVIYGPSSNAGQVMYGYAAFNTAGSGWNSVEFGPGSVIPKIDAAGGQIGPTGAVPPYVFNPSITYTSTTTSITLSWSAFTIYRMDGTTVSISSGSQPVTSLTANTSYTFYPYVAEGATTLSFATGYTGSHGSPAIAYPGGSGPAANGAYSSGNIPFVGFTFATPSSGTGGGGGGNNGCLHPHTGVKLASGRVVRAGLLRVGDELPTPSGAAKIVRIARRPCLEWWHVCFHDGAGALVTGDHRFLRPDRAEVRACDLRLGELVAGSESHLEVTGLLLLRGRDEMVSIELEAPHLYYLDGALSHNVKP